MNRPITICLTPEVITLHHRDTEGTYKDEPVISVPFALGLVLLLWGAAIVAIGWVLGS